MAVIPHSPAYEVPEFSISMWVFLLQDSTGAWRTVIHKGGELSDLTPTILLWPKERRLHVRVSTDYFWNEGLDSSGSLAIRRWTHITVVATSQLLQLYINGVADVQAILRAAVRVRTMQWNRGNIYIGRDPWHSGTRAYIDNIQFFSQALRQRVVEAMGTPLLGLISPYRVTLGCDSCTYRTALSACVDDYHMCSLKEMYAEAFLMARTMGWFRFTSDLWIRNTLEEISTSSDEMNDPTVYRVGLCCLDK